MRANRNNYPHEVIQLLHSKTPQENPYHDKNNIIILEFNDLSTLLNELSQYILLKIEEDRTNKLSLKEINDFLLNPTEDVVNKFVDDASFRKDIISTLQDSGYSVISGFMVLFSKGIDETWKRAIPRGAFQAYNENLKILLDILEFYDIKKMPPSLVEMVIYNLNRVAYYIGEMIGQSIAAHNTWKSRKVSITKETKDEIKNIAKTRNYDRIIKLLR